VGDSDLPWTREGGRCIAERSREVRLSDDKGGRVGRPFHPWGGIFDSVAVLGYNIGLEKAGGPSPLVGADPRQGAEQGFPVF